MSSTSHSPQEHYAESGRLVELVERVAAVTEDSGTVITLIAVAMRYSRKRRGAPGESSGRLGTPATAAPAPDVGG